MEGDNSAGARTVQRERVDILTVVAAGHVLLTETDGVLASCDSIENLEVGLRDALRKRVAVSANTKIAVLVPTYAVGEVNFHGKDTDILGAGKAVVEGSGGTVGGGRDHGDDDFGGRRGRGGDDRQ